MNNDLISRSALKKAIEKAFEKADLSEYEACVCVCEIYDKEIDNAPTVEPKQGKWVGKEEYDDYPNKMVCECSECGKMICVSHNDFPKFCENCGADMRGAE